MSGFSATGAGDAQPASMRCANRRCVPSRLEGEIFVQMRQVSRRLRALQTKGRAPSAKGQIRVIRTYSGPRPSVLGPFGGTYRFSRKTLLSRWSETSPRQAYDFSSTHDRLPALRGVHHLLAVIPGIADEVVIRKGRCSDACAIRRTPIETKRYRSARLFRRDAATG